MSEKVLMGQDKPNVIVLDQIIENIPYFVFWKDLESRYLGANQKFAQAAGFKTAQDIVGKNDFDGCWTQEEAEFFRKVDREVMDNDKPILNFEEPQQQLDGSTRHLLTSKVPLHDANGKVIGILGIYTDITDRKALEVEKDRALADLRDIQQQMIHTEKMRSLGEMAGGIAHEINNPLAIIDGFVQAAIKNLESDNIDKKTALRCLQKVSDTVLRIEKIVSNMRTISHVDEELELKYESLDEIITGVLSLCQEKLKYEQISFSINYDSEALKRLEVKCNRVSLTQTLLNLIGNAKDAVAELENKWIEINIIHNGSLQIQIKDSGHGVSEAIEKKMFQPFFTTKEVGKGTGIGLSLSRQLMNRQGAKLQYDHNDKNTSFLIQFQNSNIRNTKEVA